MSKMLVNIEGMSCGHCVKGVEGALKECKGVESFNVEVGSATVEGSMTKEDVTEAIEDMGFDVKDITVE